MLLASRSVSSGRPWALEVKWDGCRAQLRHDSSASLRTRNGRECSAELAEIAGALGKRPVTLDRGLVCLRDDGRPDLGRLRHRLTGAAPGRLPALLRVFGLRHLDGRSTHALRHLERRALLAELGLDGRGGGCQPAWSLDGPEEFVARVAKLGLEGVVASAVTRGTCPVVAAGVWGEAQAETGRAFRVTGIRRMRNGRVEAIHVGRQLGDGSFARAGPIELGLRTELVDLLEPGP
jgi:hypothetical protein